MPPALGVLLTFIKFTFLGYLESVRERGLYFWDKPNGAKAFTHCVRDSALQRV